MHINIAICISQFFGCLKYSFKTFLCKEFQKAIRRYFYFGLKGIKWYIVKYVYQKNTGATVTLCVT